MEGKKKRHRISQIILWLMIVILALALLWMPIQMRRQTPTPPNVPPPADTVQRP